MTAVSGNSYFSLQRGDRTQPTYDTFTVPMEFLPFDIAPLEKQLRVFANNAEFTYLDPTLLIRPTSQWWTYTLGGIATGGIACWGVRYRFDPVGVGQFDNTRTSEFAVFDETGAYVQMDGNWSIEDEFGASDDTIGLDDDQFDLDRATEQVMSVGGAVASVRFPRQLVISKVGWSSDGTNGGSSDYVENMAFEVNIGTPNAPNWVAMGSNLTQDVGNAVSHTAGQTLDAGDYPNITGITADNASTLLLTLDVPTDQYGGQLEPTIVLSEELTSQNDRVLLLRETRQDRPWVRPTNTSRGIPEQFMLFYDQIRFIVQDICDYVDINPLLSLGLSNTNPNDYTSSNQAEFHDGGGTTLSYSTVELLDTLPGAQLHDRFQIVVEIGNKLDGTSTSWFPASYSATPTTNTQYSVDSSAKTITLGAAQTADVRIRRVTRTDRWWYDPRGGQPGWNSLAVNAMQRQSRFIQEEACFLPQWYSDSPLATSIFPRGWNWLVFVGPRNKWTIPGPVWGGGGEVIIWKNNVELIEPTDYTIEWPNIIFTIPPEDDDEVTISIGGGGFGGVGLGGGGDDEETGEGPASNGGEELPPVDWPGNNIPPSAGISVSIGAASKASMSAGDWEGGVGLNFSQGNAISSEFGGNVDGHLYRVQITVTLANKIPDGGGGFYPVGTTEIEYVGKKCGTTVYRNALAWRVDPMDPWLHDESSAALGCLAPAGASGGLGLWSKFKSTGFPISSSSAPNLRINDRMQDVAVIQGAVPLNQQIPFFGQWQNLAGQANDAFGAGVTTDANFDDDQWSRFIDPFEDFDDFDIPPP